MKEIETIFADIYIGLREHYDEKKVHELSEIILICGEYCNSIGLCVNITPIYFVYKEGRELGAKVSLINYPRFPSNYETIRDTAIILAKILKDKMNQYRVSIVMNNKTYMLEDNDV